MDHTRSGLLEMSAASKNGSPKRKSYPGIRFATTMQDIARVEHDTVNPGSKDQGGLDTWTKEVSHQTVVVRYRGSVWGARWPPRLPTRRGRTTKNNCVTHTPDTGVDTSSQQQSYLTSLRRRCPIAIKVTNFIIQTHVKKACTIMISITIIKLLMPGQTD